MNKEDIKWAIGLGVGILIGIVAAYITIKTNEAVTCKVIDQLEVSCKQHQSDINILRVELSKTQTEIKNTDKSYKELSNTLKEVAESTQGVAIALARLEERQEKTDQILEKLTVQIKSAIDK